MEYPLYPKLAPAGQEEAQELINVFRDKLKSIAEEVIGNLYSDITPHIESDSWLNYRNAMMDGFLNYRNRHVQGQYEFRRLREKIFSEFRAEIIKDLDQDNLERITKLEAEVSHLRELLAARRY